MSRINKAFIKAYRTDAAEAQRVGRAPVILSEHRQAAFASALIEPQLRNLSTDELPGSSTARSVPTDPKPAAIEHRPLSSYILTARPFQQADPSQQAFFRPGTTIASFHWPAVCRLLFHQCGAPLDGTADLLCSHARSERSIIGVMGLFPKRGATTLSLCLAAKIAQRGSRIILVDGNFTNPCLSTWLEATPTAGWEEALKHVSQLSDAAIRAVDDRLDLLALGTKKVKEPLALVGGLQAAVSAGVLRHAYEIVLIDLGAYFDAASQPIVLELARNFGVDAIVAVSGPEAADPRDLATLAEQLDRSGCDLLGTIENRTVRPHAA
jgi:Mrp family chromosome partitioning ATPase